MLGLDWQTLVALIIVAAALLMLLRRAWRLIRAAQGRSAAAGCGSCSTCGVETKPDADSLVTLDAKPLSTANTQRELLK